MLPSLEREGLSNEGHALHGLCVSTYNTLHALECQYTCSNMASLRVKAAFTETLGQIPNYILTFLYMYLNRKTYNWRRVITYAIDWINCISFQRSGNPLSLRSARAHLTQSQVIRFNPHPCPSSSRELPLSPLTPPYFPTPLLQLSPQTDHFEHSVYMLSLSRGFAGGNRAANTQFSGAGLISVCGI